MNYIKQLDSIRAFAVILVIISHWIPATNVVNRIIPNGAIGVDIFFVLSGFLISKILFDNRNNADELNVKKSSIIINFYVRRSLRIFPIYYLTIFVLLIFSKSLEPNIHTGLIYFVTYTTNIFFFNSQDWFGMYSHLWSLAVEEQFYLIWPWIIIYCNKKYFLHLISIFIFIGLLSQYLMSDVKMSSVLTFNCFDAFGVGAILAWVITYPKINLEKFYKAASLIAALSFVLFIVGAIQSKWTIVPLRTLISFMTLWLITYILINRDKNSRWFMFIFNNKVLIFFGRISYGLYLYHLIIPSTLNSKIINVYFNPLLPDLIYKKYWGLLFFFENTILLIAISWLSYVFIEKRFLNLKRYFI